MDRVEPPTVGPEDGAADLAAVIEAVEAIKRFAGPDCNRLQADILVKHWRHYRDAIGEPELAAVLRRFEPDPSEFTRRRSWRSWDLTP